MKKSLWILVKKLRQFIIYKVLRRETFGVRVALIHKDKILLIKHPYDDYWVFPGGGVKRKEKPESAAIRETLEETGYKIDEEYLIRVGLYKNHNNSKKDFVYMYVCKNYKDSGKQKSIINKLEVEKQGWHNINKLPKLSPSTKRRIEEIKINQFTNQISIW